MNARRARRGVWVGGLLLAFGCGTPDLAEERAEPFPKAIRGGTADPGKTQVVAVVNFAGGQCTGIPITPDLVLTARHCIGATNETSDRVRCEETTFVDPDSAGAMFVLTTPTVTDRVDDYHRVRAYRVLPGEDASVCGRDVALLRLEQPLAVEPLVPRVDEPVVAGEVYTAYGFGDDDGEEGSGIRRVLDGLAVQCVGDGCSDREVRATEWVGSDGVCGGDSGGPALDALGRVIGVVSRGFPGCQSPIYGSVIEFADWLRSEALLAAEEANYDPPNWVRGLSSDPRYHHRIGEPCEADSACSSGVCGPRNTCTRECSSEGPCPSGYRCDVEGGLCLREPSEAGPASSCSYTPAQRLSLAWLALVPLGVGVSVRRARRFQRAPVGSAAPTSR